MLREAQTIGSPSFTGTKLQPPTEIFSEVWTFSSPSVRGLKILWEGWCTHSHKLHPALALTTFIRQPLGHVDPPCPVPSRAAIKESETTRGCDACCRTIIGHLPQAYQSGQVKLTFLICISNLLAFSGFIAGKDIHLGFCWKKNGWIILRVTARNILVWRIRDWPFIRRVVGRTTMVTQPPSPLHLGRSGLVLSMYIVTSRVYLLQTRPFNHWHCSVV